MKKLLIILLLFKGCSPVAFGQSKNDYKVYALQAISGAADGINQSLTHHHLGQGTRFWDADSSWKNKYRDFPNDKRAAYFGSKSFLVWTTDGYHLTRFVDRTAMLFSLYFEVSDIKNFKKAIVKKVIIPAAINRLFFYLCYNVIFKHDN